jgi:shikimate dehydrogenase
MHNAAIRALGLDYIYAPFDVSPARLSQAINDIHDLGITGVNVTIPHKEAIIDLLDEVTDEARRIGSVNTIVNLDGKLIGSSTDGAGFLESLIEVDFSPAGRNVMVLGAGGAARAIVFALAGVKSRIFLWNRTIERAKQLACDVNGATECDIQICRPESLAEGLCEADILVNCTSIGMNPKPDEIPIAPELLHQDMLVYDLVYNPIKTRLLAAAEAVGARTMNGVKMLVYQGALSFKAWTGIDPPVDIMEAAVLSKL